MISNSKERKKGETDKVKMAVIVGEREVIAVYQTIQ